MANPSLDPPSPGEIMRTLDGISKRLDSILDRMDADRLEAAKVYLRLDLYVAERKLLEATDADLHRDIGAVEKKIEAEAVKRQAAVDAAKSDADKKFAVIEADKKVEIQWRRTLTLGICGLGLTFVLTVAGFILNYATR